jgi:hypothetical protein
LTTDNRQHKLALLIGPPRSGKGSTMAVTSAMLGKHNIANRRAGKRVEDDVGDCAGTSVESSSAGSIKLVQWWNNVKSGVADGLISQLCQLP